jgi:hypothetical protein
MKIKITALTLMAAMMAILFVGTLIPLEDTAEGQVGIPPLELNMMSIYMVEGMELNPAPLEATDEYQAVSIPNGFIRDGFRGFNILPVGHTYWKAVGTWYTQPLKQKINLGGRAEVDIIAYKEVTGEGSPNCDFRFEVMRGNEVLLDLYQGGVRITEGVDTKVTVAGSFPPGNDTTIEAGTSLAIRITARCNGGGAIIKFGSKSYPSGISFGSNALEIRNMMISKKHFVLEYKDAFMVPWTKLHAQLYINKELIPNDEVTSMMNSVNTTRELHWEIKNKPGDYEAFASIGYLPEQNISEQRFLEINENKEDWYELENLGKVFRNNLAIVVLIVLIFVSLIMYGRHRKRTWSRRFKDLPSDLRKKDRSSRKDAWKELESRRKKARDRQRLSRVIEKNEVEEIAEDDGEFRIFKKKKKRPVQNVDPEDLLDDEGIDDIEL